jgi:hypothetical protein
VKRSSGSAVRLPTSVIVVSPAIAITFRAALSRGHLNRGDCQG